MSLVAIAVAPSCRVVSCVVFCCDNCTLLACSVTIHRSLHGIIATLCNIIFAVLYCVVLYCIVLYCAVLYCAVLCCIALCCVVLVCFDLLECCVVML